MLFQSVNGLLPTGIYYVRVSRKDGVEACHLQGIKRALTL
jgi:hypothetical protein